jgi:cyclopropane fatty-acyl-phospholipid synthase-like methyltransferase
VRRFGGDPDVRRQVLDELSARRDRVLDLAELAHGEALLDVGCGEGLIGFGALDRGAGRVIFSDVSEDLLPSVGKRQRIWASRTAASFCGRRLRGLRQSRIRPSMW